MARYTDSVLAAARHRYENTNQPLRSIAAELLIGERNLQRLVTTDGWAKRSQRVQGLPVAMQLLEEAKALGAVTLPPQSGGEGRLAPEGASRGGGNVDEQAQAPPTPDPSPPLPPGSSPGVAEGGASPSAIDRIEKLVVKEIEIEEAARAQLALKPRVASASERSARTLATLTQTLHALQRLRAGAMPHQESLYDDDMPEDIDAFRNELARRIDAFVASRMGEEAAADDSAPATRDEN
jgi:hypothetical protein